MGIATGLTAGVWLANGFLTELDVLLNTEFATDILHYSRLVDDLFIVCKASAASQILSRANSWFNFITITKTSEANSGIFLDCEFWIQDHKIRYKLYQKPQNKYLFVPRSSAHPDNTFASITYGECLRTLRRCDNVVDAEDYLHLLGRRLNDRGYDYGMFHRLRSKAIFQHGHQSDTDRSHARKIILKVVHSSDLNAHFIKRALSKHAHLLQHICKPQSIILGKSVQKNLFRLLCSHNWIFHENGREGRSRVF